MTKESAWQSYLKNGTETPAASTGRSGAFNQYLSNGINGASNLELRPTPPQSEETQLAISDYDPRKLIPSISLGSTIEPTFGQALTRTIAATLLTKQLPKIDISPADLVQERIIRAGEKILNKTGDTATSLEIPTEENIGDVFRRIENIYRKIMPLGDGLGYSLGRMDREIHQGANQLFSGAWELSPQGKATQDEYALAEQLWQQRKNLTPTQLGHILFEQIFDNSMDIIAKQKSATLGARQQYMLNNLVKALQIPPKKWFVVDGVTAFTMLSPEEQQELKNSTWTITPSHLILRQLGETDQIAIDLSTLSTTQEPGEILMIPDKPDYINIIQRALGQFYPLVDRYLVKQMGGTVQFLPKGRSTSYGEIAVRNPQATIDALGGLAKDARSARATLDLMTNIVRTQEEPLKRQIRPKKIIELLGGEQFFVQSAPDSPQRYRDIKEVQYITRLRETTVEELKGLMGEYPIDTKINDLPEQMRKPVQESREKISQYNKRGLRLAKRITGKKPNISSYNF